MGYNMSLNKIDIYMETNTKIEYKKYTIYKATLYLKTILLKNVFLKRSEWMAGIAEDLFLLSWGYLHLKVILFATNSGLVSKETFLDSVGVLICFLRVLSLKAVWIVLF